MRRLIVLLILFGTLNFVFAEGNGGYAGGYLRIGLGARGMAMGNAQVANPESGFGFYYNPAGLPYLKNFSANFSYSFLSLNRRFNYVGLSTPLKPKAGLAIGWIYSGVGDITSYNSIGEETGLISHGLHGIYFSFGIIIIENRLSLGVSGKYLLEKMSDSEGTFDYSGNGFGADFGVMLRATPWLSFGYQLKDVNAELQSNTDKIFERGMTLKNKFPLSSRVGVSLLTPFKWIRLGYDFEWSDAGEEKNHFGAEFVVPGAAIRTGYDNDHFTFGGGVAFTTRFGIKATLNYAFINSVIDEGVSHVFTWEFAL